MNVRFGVLDGPEPQPSPEQWDWWQRRLRDPRHPPRFFPDRHTQAPPETQVEEMSQACEAALWVLCADTVRRGFREQDFTTDDLRDVVRPLNLQRAHFVRVLEYLGQSGLASIASTDGTAVRLKGYWGQQPQMDEDILRYLFRRDVFLRSFYEWYNDALERARSLAGGFSLSVGNLASSFMTGPVWTDPIRSLGLSLRASLPNHPQVKSLWSAIDWREWQFWAELVDAVAEAHGTQLGQDVSIDLVGRIRVVLDGAQLRSLMWMNDGPQEFLMACEAVEDMISGYALRRSEPNITWMNQDSEPPWVLGDQDEPFDEESAPPDDTEPGADDAGFS